MFLKINLNVFILCLFFDGSKINLSELEVLFEPQRPEPEPLSREGEAPAPAWPE